MDMIVPMSVRMLLLEITAEREIDADQGLLLILAQGLISQDQAAQVRRAIRRFEDAGLHIERLGRNPQSLGDLLQDLGGWPTQSALDLAEIRVRYPGQFGQTPE